jgi:hypothetical protein
MPPHQIGNFHCRRDSPLDALCFRMTADPQLLVDYPHDSIAIAWSQNLPASGSNHQTKTGV